MSNKQLNTKKKFHFEGSLMALISLASGLHKHIVSKKPEQLINEDHEKDFYGLFYSIVAKQLRNLPSFQKMLKERANIPVFSNYINNPVTRAPRTTSRKKDNVLLYFHYMSIC